MTETGGDNSTAVLVVEDEDALRALTRRILVREGYEVIEAATLRRRSTRARTERRVTPCCSPTS